MDYLENLLKNYENVKNEITAEVKDYLRESKYTSRAELIKIGAICVLAGAVMGFLISPIKKGIHINVTNNNSSSEEEDKKCCKRKEKKKRKCCCNKEA
ncbi:MAG: hypothetical protein ACI4DU_02205 [Lachnospiraceae bacterium]